MGKVIGSLMRFTSKGRYYRDLYRACTEMVIKHSHTVNVKKEVLVYIDY